MPKYPKHFDRRETTRSRSKKQESRIAEVLSGYASINSGATLGQNDVISDFCEAECKTTEKSSFSVKTSTWKLLVDKCHTDKLPILIVDFEKDDLSLAVLSVSDLKLLIDMANKK